MQYTKLGNTGMDISPICLGCMSFGTAEGWAHVSLAWMLQKAPVVAPVIGATKLAQLESAVESLAVKLTPEEVAFLEEPYVAHPIVGHN